MIGAIVLGFVAGVIARALMPGDVFRKMSGPASWGVSILLGVAGALLGWLIFAVGFGWGDDMVFDWGGIFGAIIGTLIVLAFTNWAVRGRAAKEAEAAPAATPPPVAPGDDVTEQPPIVSGTPDMPPPPPDIPPDPVTPGTPPSSAPPTTPPDPIRPPADDPDKPAP
jgi:uncharacterized membrane protein YeaQ/YmgE (transglycosylase-associated protein family)